MDRRGRQFGPRMPLVPSLLKTFPWAHDCRTLPRKPGWAERGLHSIGRGWEGQNEKGTASGSLPQLLGVRAVFWHIYKVSMEVGGGGGTGDLGFFS